MVNSDPIVESPVCSTRRVQNDRSGKMPGGCCRYRYPLICPSEDQLRLWLLPDAWEVGNPVALPVAVSLDRAVSRSMVLQHQHPTSVIVLVSLIDSGHPMRCAIPEPDDSRPAYDSRVPVSTVSPDINQYISKNQNPRQITLIYIESTQFVTFAKAPKIGVLKRLKNLISPCETINPQLHPISEQPSSMLRKTRHARQPEKHTHTYIGHSLDFAQSSGK